MSGNLIGSLTAASVTLGQINIPANLQTVRLFFDGRSVSFEPTDYVPGSSQAISDLQAALDQLAPGSAVRIDASNINTLGYVVTVEGYVPSSPLYVTFDYGDLVPLHRILWTRCDSWSD